MSQTYIEKKLVIQNSFSQENSYKNQLLINELLQKTITQEKLKKYFQENPLLLTWTLKETEWNFDLRTGSHLSIYKQDFKYSTGGLFYPSFFLEHALFLGKKEQQHSFLEILFEHQVLNYDNIHSFSQNFLKLKCNPFNRSFMCDNGKIIKSFTDLGYLSYYMFLEQFEEMLDYAMKNFLFDCHYLKGLTLHDYEVDIEEKQKVLQYYAEKTSLMLEPVSSSKKYKLL